MVIEHADRNRGAHYWENKNAELISKYTLQLSLVHINYCIFTQMWCPFTFISDLLPYNYFRNKSCELRLYKIT